MTQADGKVLIVDDDEDVLQAARLFLKKHLSAVRTETDPEMLPRLLAEHDYDCILLDMNFARDMSSGQEGFHWLRRILEIDPSSVVILITAFGDVETAVRAIKEGAADFVLKPWQNEKLLATILAGISLRRSRLEVENLRSRGRQLAADLDQRFRDFVGVSEPMREVFGAIEKVAATEANVLILGENGTGKELVAREIHRQSLRASEVFVSVDMGAITASLFESELFGHTKGAFTDAKEERVGRFEIASGGTLFLDEIGNLPPQLQAKLLSVIENRTITRIGADIAIPIDIRLVCATNMPIYDMVAENRFRQDLLYRINTVEIRIPPLRERSDDVPPLVDHFLAMYNKKYGKKLGGVSDETMRRLRKYSWPGNVRELQHTVERAVIMSDAGRLRLEDFLPTSSHTGRKSLMFDSFNLTEVEKEVIRRALSRHAGNVSRAAEELGLTRTSLYRRMQKYDL